MKNTPLPPDKLNELETLEREIQDQGRVYLPNVRPQNKVDYIFIGTEPSLGKWATTIDIANSKIKDGFRNFIFSVEDFILLYSIENYLAKSYYITDLSKFAVSITDAKRKYWQEGLPVLLKELELFEHEKTKVISIGNSQVEFLRKNEIHPYKILLHFSTQNSHRRKQYAEVEYKERYGAYKKIMPSVNDLKSFAKNYFDSLEGSVTITAEMRAYLLSNLTRLEELSIAKEQLLFYLYNEFTNSANDIKEEPKSFADDIVQMMLNNLNGV